MADDKRRQLQEEGDGEGLRQGGDERVRVSVRGEEREVEKV